MILDKEIDKYMSVAEAAYRWNVKKETIKNKLKPAFPVAWEQTEAMIEQGLLKYFQHPEGKYKEWTISSAAMEKWFGPEKNNFKR
ncbi:MAG TPA: DNA-binding protein [Bacillus bacterium]|nr:DNA-binding protein [Bacillus sp. (in: firmicutes)]